MQGDINRAFGFGIYGGGPTTGRDADGYLPAQITSFNRQGVAVAITEFADRGSDRRQRTLPCTSRVAVTNPTSAVAVANPFPSAGLVPLAIQPDRAGPKAPWW